MPLYEYRCDECELQVEKLWLGSVVSSNTIPCPECQKDMRKLVTAANFMFKHPQSQLRGALPPNTGTSDDFNFDKAIGRDAAEKWGRIDLRNSEKDKVIMDERKKGRLVSRDQLVVGGEGSYRPITEPERVRTNAQRETAFQVAQAAKKHGRGKKGD